MIIVKTSVKLTQIIKNCRQNNAKIGFIPTMGALHQGHLELLKTALGKNCTTICSIFVNPTQFNDKNDFEKYPVTIENDIYLLEKAGCHILFLPSVTEMYPPNEQETIKVDLGNIGHLLEGKHRPGHFDGVCQIVDKFLKIILPDILFLGQKDYQQCMVIQKMVQQTRYTITPAIEIAPTMREDSGLAMSSRNKRLSPQEKDNAMSIFKVMTFIKEHYKSISYDELQIKATEMLHQAGFNTIDYIAIADAETLESIEAPATYNKPLVVLIAAYINGIRLIDNMILS